MNLNKQRSYLPLAAFLGLVFITVEILVRTGNLPSFIIPAPTKVLLMLFKDSKNLFFQHMLTTLMETLMGFFSSILIGILCALSMFYFKRAERILYPLILISQTIPTIALSPIFVLWFGYTLWSKVAMAFLLGFFPIVIGLYDALRETNSDAEELFLSMGASRLGLFLHLQFPSALPAFFSGLKLSVVYCVVGATIGEWLGASKGLGYYTRRMSGNLNAEGVFAAITLLSALGMLLFGIITIIEKLYLHKKRKNK